MELKDELSSTAIQITCYNRNGEEVKRVTSTSGEVEDPEDTQNGGTTENGGTNTGTNTGDNGGTNTGDNGGDNGDNNGSGNAGFDSGD